LSSEVLRKIIRAVIVIGIFVSMVTLQGVQDMRQVHQVVFMLSMITLFSFVLKNLWVTLFVCWTVFLYSFFKFDSGEIYISNVLFGCILYFVTKVAFRKENIDLFINGFLWFVFANITLMALQAVDFDFIYSKINYIHGFKQYVENTTTTGLRMVGFMGHRSITAMVMALAIPVMATRGGKGAWLAVLLLFVPLYLAKTSLCMLAGMVGLLFVLYFRINRKLLVGGIVALIFLGGFYISKVDGIGVERFGVWKQISRDIIIHPITGWGLDSFAKTTRNKDFMYSASIVKHPLHFAKDGRMYQNITAIKQWENPHNLILSLLYEWGLPGLVLFICFMRFNVLRFAGAIKNPNTIGLAGFILVFVAISMGHYPMWLPRVVCFIIPMFALYETSTA